MPIAARELQRLMLRRLVGRGVQSRIGLYAESLFKGTPVDRNRFVTPLVQVLEALVNLQLSTQPIHRSRQQRIRAAGVVLVTH